MIAQAAGVLMVVAFIAFVLSVMVSDLGPVGALLTALGSVVVTVWLIGAVYLMVVMA